MRSRQATRGMSFWGWLVALIVLVFGITMTLRLVPHYLDFNAIQSIVTTLSPEQVKNGSRNELMDVLQRRFTVNSLRDLKPQDVIKIKRERGGATLVIDYEVREEVFGNMSVVLSFSDERSF